MARKSFSLRIDSAVLAAMERLANDELRSLNAQIEYELRDALRRRGRLAGEPERSAAPTGSSSKGSGAGSSSSS